MVLPLSAFYPAKCSVIRDWPCAMAIEIVSRGGDI